MDEFIITCEDARMEFQGQAKAPVGKASPGPLRLNATQAAFCAPWVSQLFSYLIANYDELL